MVNFLCQNMNNIGNEMKYTASIRKSFKKLRSFYFSVEIIKCGACVECDANEKRDQRD